MAKKVWFFGKNVLITGASSGIGFYIAKALACQYGCNVFGIGRNVDKLNKAKSEIDLEIENQWFANRTKKSARKGSFKVLSQDVSSFESWKGLKKMLDAQNFKVDLLINNAGIMLPFDRFENQSLEEAKKVFDTNLFAHMYSYKTFLNNIKEVGGAIINISSSSALCPVPGTAIYGASKAASKNFTEAIALEHKKELYIAYVCPGFTSTDLFRGEEEMSKLVKSICMPAEKMANKIIRKIRQRKRRIVLGKDAHLMSGLNRLAPRTASSTINCVLKASKDKMFDKVYPDNVEKRKKQR